MSTFAKHMLATVAAEPGVELRVELAWWSDDPYAIQMVMHAKRRAITWLFGWELLAEGVKGPAGDGDVRIHPAGPGRTEIVLYPDSDVEAVLGFHTRDLDAFLGETWCAVSPRVPDFVHELYADEKSPSVAICVDGFIDLPGLDGELEPSACHGCPGCAEVTS